MSFVKTASRALLSFRHDRHKYTRGSAQIIPVTPSNYPISNKASIFKHSSHQQIPRGDGRLWETMVSLSFGAMLGHTFDCRKPATFQEVDKKIWLASLLKRRGGVQNSSLVLEHYGNIDGCMIILLFAETIDISRSTVEYEKREPAERDADAEVHRGIELDTSWAKNKGDVIQQVRGCSQAGEGSGPADCQDWSIPKIEHKVVIAEPVMKRFQTAKEICQDADRKTRVIGSSLDW